ncbi:MAG TPA: recombinase A [Candidatus Eisenbacteria bacterium]|nr:recombinase A [Candidatus Eisenbacteria bacterium]
MISSAQELIEDIVQPRRWALGEIAGRLVEISSSSAAAGLTLAFSLVLEAQRRGEIVGWVTTVESFFYPPDAALGGVDLSSVVVVRVPDGESIARAGEKLLRSGSFGLVVLDLGSADVSVPLQSRMAGLAHRYHAGLLCLTEKSDQTFSLSSLVSLRAHAERRRADNGLFRSCLRILKDKRRGPTWSHAEECHGPAGLC